VGLPAFHGGTTPQLVSAICHDPLPALPDTFAWQFRVAVMGALARDSLRRWSAESMKALLQQKPWHPAWGPLEWVQTPPDAQSGLSFRRAVVEKWELGWFGDVVAPMLQKATTMRVTRVEAVAEAELRAAFDQKVDDLERVLSSGLGPPNITDPEKLATLARLKRQAQAAGMGQVKVFVAFHGCKMANVDSICRLGPKNLRTTDGGFFGANTYAVLQPDYAAGYSCETYNLPTPGARSRGWPEEEFAMVVCLVAVGAV